MTNPTAAILIIGDEILTGRTREGNAHWLAGQLAERGFDLRQIRVVPDDHAVIVAALRELSAGHDHLFTSGGIGPTHDDITADAVAAAFDTGIGVNEDARRVMAERYAARGLEFTENRLRMARVPLGAALIDNPISAAPGFTVGNTHVMAGVPEIFRAMAEGLLPKLQGGKPLVSETLQLWRAESDVAEDLGAIAAAWPDLSMGSYPFTVEGRFGTNLVVRGTDPDRVAQAMVALRAKVMA